MSSQKSLNAENEWQFLKAEMAENKPAVTPFPEKIVRAREILLKLQVLLSAYEKEKNVAEQEVFKEKYLQAKHAYLQLAYQK